MIREMLRSLHCKAFDTMEQENPVLGRYKISFNSMNIHSQRNVRLFTSSSLN